MDEGLAGAQPPRHVSPDGAGRRWTGAALVFVLCGATLSCAADPGCVTASMPVLPAGPPPPFIEGEITWVRSTVTPEGSALAEFMIESDPADRPLAAARSPKAEVGVTCQTRVLEATAHGGYHAADATAVRTGRRASVWIDHRYPILDSNPPIISGGTVLLTAPAAP